MTLDIIVPHGERILLTAMTPSDKIYIKISNANNEKVQNKHRETASVNTVAETDSWHLK